MRRVSILSVILVLIVGSVAYAHFQLLIPSKAVVTGIAPQKIELSMPFAHPMEGGPFMEMKQPTEFGVMVNGKKYNLTSTLQRYKVSVFEKWNPQFEEYKDKKVTAFRANCSFKMPGNYLFYLIPKPYFEPAEGKFIWQIAKVVVNAYGAEEGWDSRVGLKAEIIPLVVPYGIWEGNVFRGKVLINGKPAQGIDVEVEYYNKDGRVKPPVDSLVTQVVKTDSMGIFSYAIPWAGWWGFSALGDGGKMQHKSKTYPVELDAVLWVKAFKKPKEVE